MWQRRIPQRVGRSRLAPVVVGLMLAVPIHAPAEELQLRIGKLSRTGWLAEGLQLDYRRTNGKLELGLSADKITPPGSEPIKALRIDCAPIALDQPAMRCRDRDVAITLPLLGEQHMDLTLGYQREHGTFSLQLAGLAIAGGEINAQAEWHQGVWRANIEAQGLDATRIKNLVGQTVLADWSASGRLGGDITVAGSDLTPKRVIASLNGEALAFNDATGRRAGEALNGSLAWRARREADDWIGQAELGIQAGQLYIDPVFTDFGTHPLQLSGDAILRPADDILELLDFHLEHAGIVNAAGHATLSQSPPHLLRARLRDFKATLPAAYTTYAQPFLRSTPAADLATEGRLSARLEVRDGALHELRTRTQDVSVQDNKGRFSLEQLNTDIAWNAQSGDSPRTSRISWQQGAIYGIGIGIGEAPLRLKFHGDNVTLSEPASIPVLDGNLRIERFAVRDALSADRAGELDAQLRNLSLITLTQTLGWPEFKGKLSARLPSLTYEDGVATLGGTAQAQLFGGEIAAESLKLRNPLGALPELETTITVDGLDLEAVTGAFAFGRITGSLDGRIDDLRLVGWQPAAFRAWFATPQNDPRRHRISQRAVKNLASIGGAGGAAALSRAFLRWFEDFNYRDIGLGCALRDDVCVMRGLERADPGYFIVRGKGLPRVDVIGYVETVSWSRLIEQIRKATASGGPVVD